MGILRMVVIAAFMQVMAMNVGCQVPDTNSITNEQFRKAAADRQAVILDVRTADEFKEGHIPGSINYDMLQEESFLKQIAGLPRNKTYLLYCRSGKRSLTALNIMKEQGFVDVKHLGKGIRGWDGEVVQ